MKQQIITMMLATLMSVTSFSQQVAKKTPAGRGYLEYLPSGYSSSSTLYPCIIFLHGSGERGDGSPAQLERVKAQGIPKLIKSDTAMCFTRNGVKECFIVLSPQQGTTRWSWEGNEVMPFVQYALATYRIDPKRLYLTGLSMGGDGTWMNSYSTQNNPNYFAAIAPVTCKGDYKSAMITAQRKIPVWCFYGQNDTAVPLNEAKNPINGMNDFIKSNPNAGAIAPIWTVISGAHNASTWDKIYSPTHTFYNPNVYEWFLSFGEPAELPSPPKRIAIVRTEFDAVTGKIVFTDSNGTEY